jgi:nuclear GTP-binding protein
MGSGKKEASRRDRQGKTGDGMGNVKTKGENFYRYGPLDCRCSLNPD